MTTIWTGSNERTTYQFYIDEKNNCFELYARPDSPLSFVDGGYCETYGFLAIGDKRYKRFFVQNFSLEKYKEMICVGKAYDKFPLQEKEMEEYRTNRELFFMDAMEKINGN